MRLSKQLVSCLSLLVCVAAAPQAGAAPITWSAATDVSSAADVDTNGLLVEAINAVGSASVPGSVTVNSVTFTNDDTVLANNSNDDFFSGTTGDAGYDALLSSLDFGGGSGVTQLSVGGGNLKLGSKYRVQIWFSDDRTCCNGRVMRFGDGFGGGIGANTVDLEASYLNSVGTPGQYAIGTFIADGTTQQVLALDPLGFGNAHINAYQVRRVIPEPATTALGLLALGGLGAATRRRRAA